MVTIMQTLGFFNFSWSRDGIQVLSPCEHCFVAGVVPLEGLGPGSNDPRAQAESGSFGQTTKGGFTGLSATVQ